MNPSEKQQADSAGRAEKKRYSKPSIELYGDLREITKMVGQKGNFDTTIPSHPAPNKTHV